MLGHLGKVVLCFCKDPGNIRADHGTGLAVVANGVEDRTRISLEESLVHYSMDLYDDKHEHDHLLHLVEEDTASPDPVEDSLLHARYTTSRSDISPR